MENRHFMVAFVEDMLFDLAINRTVATTPEKHITEEDREWFGVAVREADLRVREKIDFILVSAPHHHIDCKDMQHSHEEHSHSHTHTHHHYEPLTFSLKKRHRIQRALLPVRIERALVALVCDRWVEENNLKGDFKSDEALDALFSAAQKSEQRVERKYNI